MVNILQKIATDLIEEKQNKIDIYNEIDLCNFSSNISLFPYQQQALQNIIVILELYYNDKLKLKNYYLQKGFDESKYEKDNITISKILNRASFWMATGSGKSIVMIKLIEILYALSKKKYVDENDILILAPTDKILVQVKKHIEEFNRYSNFKIDLYSLKDYEKVKNENLFSFEGMKVFYYRSDLIDNESNVSKNSDGKRLNYENYVNKGKWYIILDEAHKGQAELSLKKNYYNEMAENGFIFNFSATFVDSIDKLSTVYNFNLAKFNEAGYGKNIKIVDEEYKGFNKKNDEFDISDKKDTLIKSCILFSGIKKNYQSIQFINKKAYHNPLMITVANTVNIKNADLKLYFRTLIEVAKEKPSNFELLKQELIQKLFNNREYIFGDEEIDNNFLDSLGNISYEDVLKNVFNSNSTGIIECKKTASKDEILFKIKTSSESSYFGLLKISDISSWSNGILYDYDITEDLDDIGYFDSINEKDSSINILMGSKIFSEGWDSNRPNVINFLNIGSKDARKYVMQTIGRGVRIEPMPNLRKRISNLSFSEEDEFKVSNELKNFNNPLESLYIFATSKKDIETIFNELPTENEKFEKLNGIRKNKKINMPLYIPKYSKIEEKQIVKYNISKKEFNKVLDFISDTSENVLLMNLVDIAKSRDLALHTLNKISSNESEKYFIFNGLDVSILDPIEVINKIDRFFNSKIEDVSYFIELDDEIKHYTEIKVNIEKIKKQNISREDIEEDILNFSINKEDKILSLKKQLTDGKISIDEYTDEIANLGSKSVRKTYKLIDIKNIKEHFYTPILLKDKNENDFFKNIINEESEITFINELEEYLTKSDNFLKSYDNWYFSKIQQNIDSIYIPYIDYETSSISKFFPDFIFWLKKEEQYYIKFIDPKGIKKGTENTRNKLEGFEKIFKSDNFINKFPNYNVDLYLFNQTNISTDPLIQKYLKFDINDIFEFHII